MKKRSAKHQSHTGFQQNGSSQDSSPPNYFFKSRLHIGSMRRQRKKDDMHKEERIGGVGTCSLWRNLIYNKSFTARSCVWRQQTHAISYRSRSSEASEARKFQGKPVPAHTATSIMAAAWPGAASTTCCHHSGARASG